MSPFGIPNYLADWDKTRYDPPQWKGLTQLKCGELVEVGISDLRESEKAFINCRKCEYKHPLFYNHETHELKVYRKHVTQTGKNIIYWRSIHFRKTIDWEVF